MSESESDFKAAAARNLNLHPIAGEAADMVKENESGGVYFLDEDLKQLEKSLEKLAHDRELKFAVRSIVALAAYIDEDLGFEDEAMKLMYVAASATAALQRQNADDTTNTQDVAEAKAGALQDFAGGKETKTAPKYGDKKAEGGVSLKDLFKPGRLTGR